MRTQTWSFSVQLTAEGQARYSISRSFYTPNGHQLPQLLELEDLVFGQLHQVASDFADEVTRAAAGGA